MNVLDHLVTRNRESFQHKVEIHQPFGGLDITISWCKENILNDWRWQLVQVSSDHHDGRYIFYFDSERDYCAFMLRWS